MKKVWFVAVCLMTVLMAACGSSSESSSTTDLPTAEFTIVATDIAYDTDQLEVAAGQPIAITFKNDGFLEHDFSIMEIEHSGEVMSHDEGGMDGHDMGHMSDIPDVHVAAAMNGGSSSLEFTPSEPGEYEFFCTVAGHKEAGMVGKLIVNAP